jgi:hypothetical protein
MIAGGGLDRVRGNAKAAGIPPADRSIANRQDLASYRIAQVPAASSAAMHTAAHAPARDERV